ncbi:Glutaminase A [Metarhizium brunneum]|uniref:Glutaminase A n=1 Tax=Metarhizium brunneum TaxID=500148 RepID=A0A7D5Z4P2_9HYPO
MFLPSINTTGEDLYEVVVETPWLSTIYSPGLQQSLTRIPGVMKFVKFASAAVLAVIGGQVGADSSFTPARPPAVPLAVRNPYLNVWLNGQENGPHAILPGQWPKFWATGIQGWQGFVKVDGEVYNWMGGAPGAPNVDQLSLEYTSTRSIFNMSVADKVDMRVEFLSPVYPDDLRRQSVPFSYINVAVKSRDGKSHRVQVYSDVSGEWASGDTGAVVEWDTSSNYGVRSHRFWKQKETVFQEDGENAAWGTWYWSTGDQSGVSYKIGSDVDVRGQFLQEGSLDNRVDNLFRAVNDRWPVFALSRDLGTVKGGWAETVFTIGVAQRDSIQWVGEAADPQSVPSLWASYFQENDLVPFFYHDYDNATHAANRLDLRIQRDSVAAAGQDYATITTLSLRQTFGALAYTGTPDNPLIFLKEISSNSDIQTVDVIFPAFPILLYLNPNLLKYLLEPLLLNDRYHYPNDFAQHDLGRFPRALGYADGNDEHMPLEECGNMIIMMLAYSQMKHDDEYLSANWDLLVKWAQYMIDDAKIPASQLSTDDFAGHLANQTNLAIKGIIALQAMSEVATRAGFEDESSKYSTLAKEYLEFWTEHGVNAEAGHSMLQYDNKDSYGLLYNIYPDKLLGLDFIPQEIYDMQSDFYLKTQKEYGVILDTRNVWTKVDWELFAAAVAKPETQNMFISKIARWINETPTWRAFTDLYDVNTGGYPGGLQFTARPVVGGTFSLLALKK